MLNGSVRSNAGVGAGTMVALVSAATFATSGPIAKSLLETGWSPGAVALLRIGGAGLILLVPALRALDGRWHLLVRNAWQVVLYGALAVALPQLAFFYAVQHLSVGVALLLEYLGLILVVTWQCLVGRRRPGGPTTAGIALALTGLVLVLDILPIGHGGGVQVDGVGVAWGLLAAVGLGSFFLMSGHSVEHSLPPITLAGSGLAVAGVGFAVLGLVGVLPMHFHNAAVHIAGTTAPWWVAVLELAAIAAATAYATGVAAARMLGATLASFVGLAEVMFAVLFAWLLLGEMPHAVQLVGGLFILGGVVAVRWEEARPVRARRPGSPSAAEARLALAVPLLGEGPIVADDRVERDSVDVPAAQDDRSVVGAVQEECPL
jgi:drug/metabolite transporter (DMT)-like permease